MKFSAVFTFTSLVAFCQSATINAPGVEQLAIRDASVTPTSTGGIFPSLASEYPLAPILERVFEALNETDAEVEQSVKDAYHFFDSPALFSFPSTSQDNAVQVNTTSVAEGNLIGATIAHVLKNYNVGYYYAGPLLDGISYALYVENKLTISELADVWATVFLAYDYSTLDFIVVARLFVKVLEAENRITQDQISQLVQELFRDVEQLASSSTSVPTSLPTSVSIPNLTFASFTSAV